MSRKDKTKGKLAPFVPIFRHTMKSAAWNVLSVGARATFLHLKSNYNTNSQNAVFLSSRDGAKELGVTKNTVCKWLHELEHYGFIVMVQGAHLGLAGTGKAARYRLTDSAYAGQAPTYNFQNWDGVLFDPKKQKPVPKSKTHRPKKVDIRAESAKAEKGNKRLKKRDIRDAVECPKKVDITSSNHCLETFMQNPETIAKVKMMRTQGMSYRKIHRQLAEEDKMEWTTPTLTEVPWDDDHARLYQETMAMAA
jgi:hypothetical protein